MYRPQIFFPSDDYTGGFLETVFAAGCFVLEQISYCICGILCCIFVYLEAGFRTWAFAVVPIVLFDFSVCIIGASKLCKNYRWLFLSELKTRVIDLVAFAGRIFCLIGIALYFRYIFPLWFIVVEFGLWYLAVLLTNCWVKSRYIWIRCHCCEFLCFTLISEIYLKHSGFIDWSWVYILSPGWLLCSALFLILGVFWHFTQNEQEPDVAAVLRLVFSGITTMGFSYFLFLKLLGTWLDNQKVPFISWMIPLITGQLIHVVFTSLGAIAYTMVQINGIGWQYDSENGPACSPQTIVRPTLRNMNITLDKVGNNFYKLTGFKNGSVEENPNEKARLTQAPAYSSNYTDLLTENNGNEIKGSNEKSLSSDEWDLCIICFQMPTSAVFIHCGHGGMCVKCAQTCFRRTGKCPTCRQPITGVATFEPSVAFKQDQITACVVDAV